MDPYDISNTDWEDDLRQLRWRLASAALFLLVVTLVGVVGYHLMAPHRSWVDAFYMTAITLTTVGFSEIIDLQGNPGGRIFTALLILVGMGGVLYFVTTATAFVLEGQLGHVFWRRRMQKSIDALTDHLIVCGSGSTAAYTVEELVAVERPVVLIVEDQDRVAALRRQVGDVPVVLGDPGSDETLLAAGIERAAGLVACTENDRENLVITLSARQLNPAARIVSRVTDVETERKVRKVGADAVVSPTHIGGLRMASELIRPTVVSFLDTMLRDREGNLRIDEVVVPEDSESVGRRLEELRIDKVSRALLVAVREPGGGWRYNPPGSLEVTADLVLILLGSPQDLGAVCDAVDGRMVSKPATPTAS